MAQNKTATPDKTLIKSIENRDEEGTPPSDSFVPYLVVIDGPRRGTRFPLDDGDNLIGRSPTNTIIFEDQSVSRHHSAVKRTGEGWTVKDRGSKNGTFVNGHRIAETVNIGHKDVIQAGIYSLRLITQTVTSDEEMAALPPEMEAGTMVMEMPSAGDTATHENPVEGERLRLETEGGEGDLGTDLSAESKPATDDTHPPIWRRPRSLVMAGIIAATLIIGGLSYWIFLAGPSSPTSPPPLPVAPILPPPPGVASEPTPLPPPPPAPVPVAPVTLPVFLDFAASPLPAQVSFEGKDYGSTPVKINMELTVGQTYVAAGLFKLEEIKEEYTERLNFTVAENQSMIPILFRGPIGVMKITQLPRDVQVYLEGYFAYDQFKARTAKLDKVALNKPIYLPFGRYTVELRQPKEISGGQFVEDIRFRREVFVTEDNPTYILSLDDNELTQFPVEIRSTPSGAQVFIDAAPVGKTPFTGTFPLGTHTLTLKKEGYFDTTQPIAMDINTLYQLDAKLETTAAGEAINAGRQLLQKGLYKDAVSKLSEVFNHQPTPGEVAQTQYLLGTCFVYLQDLATAKGYFDQAKGNLDYKYPAMLGLVTVHHAEKQLDKALPLLVEVLLKAEDETTIADARALFKQISPLRSLLYVYSDPPGATVYINNEAVAQPTPVILHDLGLGNYKIKVSKNEYLPQEISLNLSINEFNPIFVKLKKAEK